MAGVKSEWCENLAFHEPHGLLHRIRQNIQRMQSLKRYVRKLEASNADLSTKLREEQEAHAALRATVVHPSLYALLKDTISGFEEHNRELWQGHAQSQGHVQDVTVSPVPFLTRAILPTKVRQKRSYRPCPCGSRVMNMSQHLKSSKHMAWQDGEESR